MEGKIVQFFNLLRTKKIFPKTLTKAVFDENGNRLDQMLDLSAQVAEEADFDGIIPRDADTLDGHAPSYFATKEYTDNQVSALNADLTVLKKYDYKTSKVSLPAGNFYVPNDGMLLVKYGAWINYNGYTIAESTADVAIPFRVFKGQTYSINKGTTNGVVEYWEV